VSALLFQAVFRGYNAARSQSRFSGALIDRRMRRRLRLRRCRGEYLACCCCFCRCCCLFASSASEKSLFSRVEVHRAVPCRRCPCHRPVGGFRRTLYIAAEVHRLSPPSTPLALAVDVPASAGCSTGRGRTAGSPQSSLRLASPSEIFAPQASSFLSTIARMVKQQRTVTSFRRSFMNVGDSSREPRHRRESAMSTTR
jgi:hypothetical protein